MSASPSPSFGQDESSDPGQPATIVGLWHVIYTANYVSPEPGPLPLPTNLSSFEFAETLKIWHADGTEWEQKIGPPPAGGFCFGVWKHAADGSAKLRHIGVIFADDGSIYAIFYDDEINRVSSDGKTYYGTFDFKIYDKTDVLGTGPVLQEIKGTTAATRITLN